MVLVGQPAQPLVLGAGKIRDAPQPEPPAARAPAREPVERDSDALDVDLGRAHHEHARRIGRPALGPRRKLARVEGLTHVRDGAEAALLERVRERARDRELFRRQAIGRLDLRPEVPVEGELAFVALAEVEDRAARSFERGRDGPPERRHAHVRARELRGVGERGPLEVRLHEREPVGRGLGRDDGDTMPAPREGLRLQQDDLHASRERGRFEEIGDSHSSRAVAIH
jgi:hypothetical protein